MGMSDTSAPVWGDHGASQYGGGREPYPAWDAGRQIPLSKEEIEDIFLDLQQKFGFQRDSMRNMVRLPLSPLFLPSSPAPVVSLTSPCNYWTVAPHGCLPIKLFSRCMRIISVVSMPTTANGTSPRSST